MEKKFVFIGGTLVGYKSLIQLINIGTNLSKVFIEREHDHEINKYWSKMEQICKDNNIPYEINCKIENMYDCIRSIKPHAIMCIGCRRYIPKKVYSIATDCSLGTHFALLPKYRGFAPVNWAIINGENKTGVTLFHLDEGIDSGDIVSQKEVDIYEHDNINTVLERCIKQLENIIKEEVTNIENNLIKRQRQNEEEATYICSRSPEDGRIDWSKTTKEIHNLIRAITYPLPGAFSYLDEEKIIILESQPVDVGKYVGRIPGKIIKIDKNKGVVVLTGDGAILIKKIIKNSKVIDSVDTAIKSIRKSFK